MYGEYEATYRNAWHPLKGPPIGCVPGGTRDRKKKEEKGGKEGEREGGKKEEGEREGQGWCKREGGKKKSSCTY